MYRPGYWLRLDSLHCLPASSQICQPPDRARLASVIPVSSLCAMLRKQAKPAQANELSIAHERHQKPHTVSVAPEMTNSSIHHTESVGLFTTRKRAVDHLD